MLNIAILFLQIVILAFLNLFFLRRGLFFLSTWLCIVALSMNLLISKEIVLFGLQVTCTDALTLSYCLGLNIIQEFYGRSETKRHIWTCFLVILGFILLTQIHLLYQPSESDTSHESYLKIFSTLPRILIASLTSFLTIQFFDISFFSRLRKKMEGKYFALRSFICTLASQFLDSFIFTFLGLYGIVENVFDIILFSMIIKGVILIFSTPFLTLARFFYRPPANISS